MLKRHSDSVHSTEKIVREVCGTPFTRKDYLLHHLNNRNCERKLEKEAGKRKRVDLTVSIRGSSSFIEVPRQIAKTKAIINVINKKDSQCFMGSNSRSSPPQHQQPQENIKLYPPPK
ncbi:hypothetical protein TNCV_4394931 [Trichonephila clavipes]|uniref:Uncharacterized protein n=1 Tax=Trichonephila clavipes TaxID=2585209 RepID=A0A8X7BEZ3_TRICX|nr:hypothetical protein TNCV_4394931 [Trichonephila clavipes]